MRIALINSGLGLLAPAAELHRLRNDADLVLAMDPDGMPWGPRTPDDIAARSLAAARAAAAFSPDALVFACNTGTVHAIGALRAEFEPAIPVVGTVPAIKPAAAGGGPVAVWATVATTASDYQRRLIAEFAGPARVTAVACPGLADAVDAGDEAGTRAAVELAASRTPDDCAAVVLGCTEYELAAGLIGAALPGVTLFRSAAAVAAQALRRASSEPKGAAPTGLNLPQGGRPRSDPPPRSKLREGGSEGACDRATRVAGDGAVGAAVKEDGEAGGGPAASQRPTVTVLLSGRRAGLPAAALRYPEGRLMAALADRGPEPERRAPGPESALPLA